jgi:hypothetical protein
MDLLCLVHALDRHVLPVMLLIIATACHALLYHMLFVARHLIGGINKDASGNNMLLYKVNKQHQQGTLADRV